MTNNQIKTKAMQIIGTTKPSPVFIAIMYVGIAYILNSLSINLTGVRVNIDEYYNAMTSGDVYYFQNIMQNWHPGALSSVVSVVLELLKVIMYGGFIIYTLNAVRCNNPNLGNILDGFGIWLKLVLLVFIMSLFIALWSILLVIPGIIAFYRYRMAIYILIDDPSKSVLSCLRESSRLMKGNKRKLFSLDFSFIGWYILTIIPFVSIWVTPYTQTAYALFYENICPRETVVFDGD